VFAIDLVRCEQSRRRPVNVGGERHAKLDRIDELKQREVLLFNG
jgi:hypothetical protein